MESKLKEIFVSTLDATSDQVNDDLKYSVFPNWDSVAHMALIAAIEEAFDIMVDAEDVIDMSSFAKAKEIVSKYIENK